MSHQRHALLIGNASYPEDAGLPDLACPLNDIDGLAEVLRDSAIGGFDSVEALHDATRQEAERALHAFFNDAGRTDTRVVYYSGHGKLDSNFALHLCTRDCETDALEPTSISFRYINDLLGKCQAEKTVLVLDCCYSGAAEGVRARGHVSDQLKVSVQGTGAYLLTASGSVETAQEKEGERYGVFTGHLIDGLASGRADRDGRGFVTMDDLYHYVVRAVRADSPQRPTRQVDGSGDFVIASSGKDPRKDRVQALRKVLFERVAGGDVDEEIARAVVGAARKLPAEHNMAEARIDKAASEYLAEHMSLGRFVGECWQARMAKDEPVTKQTVTGRMPFPPRVDQAPEPGSPAPDPEPDRDPVPEPDGLAPERQASSERDGNWMPMADAASAVKTRTKAADRSSRLGRILGSGIFVNFLTPVLAVFFVIAAILDAPADPAQASMAALAGVAGVIASAWVFRKRMRKLGWLLTIVVILAGLFVFVAAGSESLIRY